MTTELFSAVTGSFGDIQTWALSALNVVLPVAITLFGIMFMWFLISKFFKRLVGVSESKEKVIDDEPDDDD